MPDESATLRHPIGSIRGVTYEVAAWDSAHAEVDLSAAGMFMREAVGANMQGGLLHLDQTLGGALTELRKRGDFRAEAMETLLIRTPPSLVRAKQLLIVGLGDPAALTAALLARAIRVTVREAIRAGARSAAFAPSLLDSGVVGGVDGGGALAMLGAALETLAAEAHLAELGLSPAPTLTYLSFDAGPTHLKSVGAEFSGAFAQLTSV